MSNRPSIEALVAGFADLPVCRRVIAAVEAGSHRKVGGLWGGSTALLIAALRRARSDRILVVTADDVDSVTLQADLQSCGLAADVLPRQETDDEGEADPQSRSERHRALRNAGRAQAVLLAGIEAMMQPAPAAGTMRRGLLRLECGQQLARDTLLDRAQKAGLRSVPLVLTPGEISVRGDVVDLYPMAADAALRLEFFDDQLESIRTFDPGSQRTVAVLERIDVSLGADKEHEDRASVVSHLEKGPLTVLFHEPLRIEERTALLASFDSHLPRRRNALQEVLDRRPQLHVSALPSHDLDFRVLSAGSAVGSGEADPLGRLRSVRGVNGSVLLLCRTEQERERLQEIFEHKSVDTDRESVSLEVGGLSRGFRIPELSVTVLSNIEFAGAPQQNRVRERMVVPSRAIQSFFELGPGDTVVHAVHGLARFVGMELVERGDAAEDHLRLSFQDDVQLLVPASKIHLVQKYVGSGKGVTLDKLGGKGFQRRKEQVQESLFDLASDLLEVQAARQAVRRPPYPTAPSERDFLDGFPFRDTTDQATTWKELQEDLQKDTPMDRLLCGDVGFGKTEMALRAAFRVALHGRQVAVLVPTTILAEQHAETFRRRCEPYGLSVGMLSRYLKPKDRTLVKERLLRGQLDIVVGTHQLLGNQVDFHDLGMVIIDEEQRFGVRQKEKLKQLRAEVDVLTLSATPIPRTLHGSMLGIRAISTLSVPPAGRQEVQTRVVFRDDNLLQQAVQRELAREGQVFYLHNRIDELELIKQRLVKLVPQARVAIGHGQMTEKELEATVRAFVRGDYDVLVSTTIIENGLDLPRANTILVDRADMFGLAELHQLRGRVGRSDRQAFCHLMLDHAAPPSNDARKRLKALEEFSQLGAGFMIAMKDLEIRGAGNLLGPQQSGHIASVGYDMYCQLLRQAVEAARERRPAYEPGGQEVDVDLRLRAFLPESFLKEPRQRLELLREMDEATDDAALTELQAELRDRYGKLPPPVQNLLSVFRLKHALTGLGLLSVQWVDEERLVVRHRAGEPLGGGWLDCFTDVRQVEAGKTHLILPPAAGRKRQRKGEDVLQFLLDALAGRLPAAGRRRG